MIDIRLLNPFLPLEHQCVLNPSGDRIFNILQTVQFHVLSKSGCFLKLVTDTDEENNDEVYIHEIPGGSGSFEMLVEEFVVCDQHVRTDSLLEDKFQEIRSSGMVSDPSSLRWQKWWMATLLLLHVILIYPFQNLLILVRTRSSFPRTSLDGLYQAIDMYLKVDELREVVCRGLRACCAERVASRPKHIVMQWEKHENVSASKIKGLVLKKIPSKIWSSKERSSELSFSDTSDSPASTVVEERKSTPSRMRPRVDMGTGFGLPKFVNSVFKGKELKKDK
ncbi:unnamed protein product [Sphenostylis stenocarpa]|uniref:Uncharacterized protein n=1 Tax=Sphenostylis stenocarpa TaxID=92480 RepID=A0AA86VXS4_9FABA|nr:unnamed protein product [Sphenostylis stenocarpa]